MTIKWLVMAATSRVYRRPNGSLYALDRGGRKAELPNGTRIVGPAKFDSRGKAGYSGGSGMTGAAMILGGLIGLLDWFVGRRAQRPPPTREGPAEEWGRRIRAVIDAERFDLANDYFRAARDAGVLAEAVKLANITPEERVRLARGE